MQYNVLPAYAANVLLHLLFTWIGMLRERSVALVLLSVCPITPVNATEGRWRYHFDCRSLDILVIYVLLSMPDDVFVQIDLFNAVSR